MAVQTVIPSSNTLLADIRDTLNDGGSSCTNEVLSFFDSRAVINVWSFRKPYSSSANLFKLTDQQIRDQYCGFNLLNAQIASYTKLPEVMDGDMNGWTYVRPSGGENSPYRVGDYVGYYKDAQPMIRDFQVPSTVSNQFSNTVSATAIVQQQDGKSVSLQDLGILVDAYPAIYMVNSSGTQSRQYTGSTTIGEGGTFNVDFDASNLTTTGNWKVYPFLVFGNVYYTLPNVKVQTMNVVASFFTISVRAVRNSDFSISYTITVNNTSSAVTWTNNTYRLRFSDKEFTDSIVAGEMTGNLTSPQTIAGNSTTTITGKIENVNSVLWGETTIVLWVSFQSANYVQRGVVASLSTT